MTLVLGVILSYLIGSIPTAYIFGKLYRNIDIRQHGSGNVGATNVFRVLGKKPGIIVLIIDVVKGVIPFILVIHFCQLTLIREFILLAIAVVAGHNWTIFLNFKGGKGIATSLGVLIGLSLKVASFGYVLGLCLLSWLICFFLTRFVSLSSMVAAVLLPIFMVMAEQSFEMICLGCIFAFFVVLRHRANIRRLIDGQEPRVALWRGSRKSHD